MADNEHDDDLVDYDEEEVRKEDKSCKDLPQEIFLPLL